MNLIGKKFKFGLSEYEVVRKFGLNRHECRRVGSIDFILFPTKEIEEFISNSDKQKEDESKIEFFKYVFKEFYNKRKQKECRVKEIRKGIISLKDEESSLCNDIDNLIKCEEYLVGQLCKLGVHVFDENGEVTI